ncbi:MAG: transposase [Candidatus Nealsonbacteria bacterium]|nr:transposase [Candidatus Nealsonbacteria bacterium]
MRKKPVGRARSAARRLHCTIIRRSVLGVIWIRASIGRCCTQTCRGHVAKHLGDAVDKVRRAENQQLREAGDNRLVGTKFDWLKGRDKFDEKRWRAFCRLRRSTRKTSRAWAMREQAMTLWDYSYRGAAENHFRWWYRWATHSRLKPMIDKAKMLKSHLKNILNYLTQPITNALSESINAKIQWVKYTARGFRNRQNFKTAIYFHCGGLDLLPAT